MNAMRARLLALFLFAGVAAAPLRAEAQFLELGLGANYWLTTAGVFPIDIAIKVPVAHAVAVGGRFGVALATSPGRVAVPLDLAFSVLLTRRFYLDITGGPWIIFGGSPTVAGHFALGFGLRAGFISFGPEVGYLEPNGIVGVRLSFRL